MFEKLRRTEKDYIERIAKTTPLSNIGAYKIHFISKGIPYGRVIGKRYIEDFALENQRRLQHGGEIYNINGDVDWISNNEVSGTDTVRKILKDTIERCGGGCIKVLTNSSVKKGGQALENAKILQDMGVPVKVRSIDEDVRAIHVRQPFKQPNKNGSPDFEATCVWRSFAKRPHYGRREGFPQQPRDMDYVGWVMKYENWDGYTDEGRKRLDVLSFVGKYSRNLWNSTPTFLDDVIKEREMLRGLDDAENTIELQTSKPESIDEIIDSALKEKGISL